MLPVGLKVRMVGISLSALLHGPQQSQSPEALSEKADRCRYIVERLPLYGHNSPKKEAGFPLLRLHH
jgi:hypothetical protein